MHANKYKTSLARLCAAIVDGIVFIPFGFLDDALLSPSQPSWLIIAWAAISYSSYWLYTTILHARYGQTVGKKLMRIKVLDVNEGRMATYRQALLRDSVIVVLNTLSVAYVAYLVLKDDYTLDAAFNSAPGEVLLWASFAWVVLELLTMLTNPKRRALHDFMARTVVVRDA